MQPTILIARDRKTGKDVILCGSEVPYAEQNAAYLKVATDTHEQYSSAGLYYLSPARRLLQFNTQKELDARSERNAELKAPEHEENTGSVTDCKQALTKAEEAEKTANLDFQKAKKAYGICTEVARKPQLFEALKTAKAAARKAISVAETARQKYHQAIQSEAAAVRIGLADKPGAKEEAPPANPRQTLADILSKKKKEELVSEVEAFNATAPEDKRINLVENPTKAQIIVALVAAKQA